MPDVTMPQLGETVTEGTITKWFKKVGDHVDEDELLFEVSTDKVDSEVPSPASGVVAELRVDEGATVDVGVILAVITDEPVKGSEGEAEPEPVSEPVSEKPTQAAPEPPEAAAQVVEPKPEVESAGPATEAPATPAPSSTESGSAGSRLLSPVVRRLVTEHGLDPAEITGTGQGGRITRADVLSHAGSDGGGPVTPSAPPRRTSPPPSVPPQRSPQSPSPKPTEASSAQPPTSGAGGDQVVPFSNIRRRTAEHMMRSLATAAHVLTSVEVDFVGVDSARHAARDEFKAREGFSLTYLPFVARAVIDAIAEFPHLNASVRDEGLVLHGSVNLGIAVDLSFEGLIVPVVRNADGKRLRAIAREISQLAGRARTKNLSADDISDGTFTITNPGPFGTLLTAPVINQPQVAILSTDGVKKRPVAIELPDGSDGIAIHPVGNLALSFDHRAFDGAYASAFLARCREIIETRDWAEEL